jgi:hypothetical protein
MYNASTSGKNLSKRQFKQQEKTQNFNVDAKPGPLEHIGAPQLDYNANLTNNPTPLVPYVKEQPKAKKKPKAQNESLINHLKDFFTSKDTNHDGQRDGLLGLADRFILPISQAADEVLLPGNEAMQRKNDKEQNHGVIKNPAIKAGMIDRGTETKVLQGLGTLLGYTAPYGEAGKGVNLALNKLPGLASKLSNPLAEKVFKGVLTGTTAETGLAAANELVNPDAGNLSDYAKRVGIGAATAGVGEGVIHGAGKAFEAASNKAMNGLLSNSESAQKLSELINKYHQEQAPLPGRPDPRNASELIPSGNDIANPSYVPKVTSSKVDLAIPKVGTSIDETPAFNVNVKEYTLPNGKKIRVKNRVTQGIKNTEQKINELKPIADEYQKEFNDAVDQQYNYLKNSMGKGVEYGTTGSQTGYVREINGSFRISNNPKWYQDFYKDHGRKPSDKELRQLAVQHVKEGFHDNGGALPAWQPKKIQEIDDQIHEVTQMLHEMPDQEEALKPILDALDEEKAIASQEIQTAVNDLPALQKQHADLVQSLNAPKQPKAPQAKAKPDTAAIDHEINKVSQQIDHIKKQPKGPTKTAIDDQLRSLDINDGYLTSARRDKKISEEDYRRRYNENQVKREALLKQQKAFTP